jgi:protein-L-isoaspartate(D-aspartate) O-methyltransferase
MTIDYAAARRAMLEGQVRVNDVTDRELQNAIAEVPRELFVPKLKRPLAYGDIDLPVAPDRWLMRPRDFAKLVQALEVAKDDVVLDIACGRGYSSAVLARLAAMVVGLESSDAAIEKAEEALGAAGVVNAAIVKADLKAGVPDQGPYDVIFVNGAVEIVPDAWLSQLADGGRLGVVVEERGVGRATVFTRAGGVVGSRIAFDCATPVLPGFERPRAFDFGAFTFG